MTTTTSTPGIDGSLRSKVRSTAAWRVPGRALAIVAVYAGCATLVLIPGGAYAGLLLWPFMGFVLAGFLNAAHDCVHRTHLRSKTGNRIMGTAWCTPILIDFTLYRWQHFAHHRHTGVDGDTESHTTYGSLRAYLYALSGVSHWRSTFASIVRTLRGRFPATVNTDQRRRDARLDAGVLCCWLVLVSVLTAAFPLAVLFAYWLPLLFYPAAIMLLSLPEHYGLNGVPEVEHNTRSVRSNAVVRFFQWNANFHAEHHAFPATPALNLPRLYAATVDRFDHHETSYVRFHTRVIKALRARG
jgi:fatty acid desaturase